MAELSASLEELQQLAPRLRAYEPADATWQQVMLPLLV
jgi:hypothetical protein